MIIKYPKTLINAIDNGHMLIDEQFTIHFWNRWLEINTQIPYTDIVGKSLKDFYPDLNYEVLKRKIKTAKILGTPSFYDSDSNIKFIPINRNKVTTSTLKQMQQQVTISPYIPEKGLVMISIYDISELHETKLLLHKEINNVNKLNNELESRVQEALENNKMRIHSMIEKSRQAQMGEMISMIAHQWRQPLSSISTIAINIQLQSDLKNYDLKKDEDAKEYTSLVNDGLKSIGDLIQVLSNTIDDFRNFYAPEKNKTYTNIAAPIKKALHIIEGGMNLQSVSIVENYDTDIKIGIYYNELMQVFLNLFKNSQDNFKEKEVKDPTIWIKTYTDDSNVIVEVIDNGGGIHVDDLEEVFEPYFSTKGKNGTGLGLYMSKTIIEEHHNGNISVQNIDNNTCFTIKIPKK